MRIFKNHFWKVNIQKIRVIESAKNKHGKINLSN